MEYRIAPKKKVKTRPYSILIEKSKGSSAFDEQKVKNIKIEYRLQSIFPNPELSARKRVTGYHFFVFPDSSGAQLREPKLALTKPTKIEAYIVQQLANQKGAARQKALEVQNSITKFKMSKTAEAQRSKKRSWVRTQLAIRQQSIMRA